MAPLDQTFRKRQQGVLISAAVGKESGKHEDDVHLGSSAG